MHDQGILEENLSEKKKKNYTTFCNDSNIVSWFPKNGINKNK